MDTIFEFVYYLGFVACLSSLNNDGVSQTANYSHFIQEKDSTICLVDSSGTADSLKQKPLLLGAQQAKRLSECDSIGFYQED